jgi:hypothetical protein
MSFEIEYFEREETHAIATWRNVLLIESRLESPASSAGAMRRAAADLRRKYPDGFGHFTIVESACKSPSADARAGAASVLDEYGDSIRGAVIVFLGSGLRGAFVRAVVASMMALSRSQHRVAQEICPSVGEGTRWLAGRMAGLDARALTNAVEAVRSSNDPAPTAKTRG